MKARMNTKQMKAYLFVDAENHFLRSTAAAEEVIGSPKAARALSIAKTGIFSIKGIPDKIKGERFGWDSDLQLFWDCELLSPDSGRLPQLGAYVERAVYACSCAGDDDKVYETRVKLRGYGFDPIVVKERKVLKNQRETSLNEQKVHDKPKGCDIAIATRMVADAAADLYDCCLLFTSDADFLPAVEAIRRMGKIVWVFGYSVALQNSSPYLYVPDRFVDLREELMVVWNNNGNAIKEALKTISESAK